MDNFIKVFIPTLLAAQGGNFITFSFQNGEIFIFSFYINIVDGNMYMSINNSDGSPIMEDRRIVISDNLFGDCNIQGIISVEGEEPNLQTIDNSCNIYYSYYSQSNNSVSSKTFKLQNLYRRESRDILRIKAKIRTVNDKIKENSKRNEIVMGLDRNFHKKPFLKRIKNIIKNIINKVI